MVYNIAMFVQASDWTAEQWMIKNSVRFSSWPAATFVYQKGLSQTRSYHAKSYLLVKIVRRLHCSSIQPCFLPDNV